MPRYIARLRLDVITYNQIPDVLTWCQVRDVGRVVQVHDVGSVGVNAPTRSDVI